MKNILVFYFFILNSYCFSQDTLVLFNYPDGGSKIQVLSKKDTVIYTYYTAKKLESKHFRDPETGMTRYIRYYRNGKAMWDKLESNGVENGVCKYYNNRGVKVAEFSFHDGEIIDTLFMKTNTYMVFGKLKNSSIVYGGMDRGDDNYVQEPYVGPYTRFSMKFVKLDTTISSQNWKEFLFTSDHQGKFFVIIESGQFGLFTKDYSLNEIYKGQFCPSPQAGGSWSSGWDMNTPLMVDTKSKINFVVFTHSSVGYAP